MRVRFAPSPTGFLHIGGVRTALFNWLFARHAQGKFILRIEDTDRGRSEEKYLKQILQDLKWLGLDWDEGPYFQSERLALYQELAQKLLQQKLAYPEGQAVILKVPDKPFEFTDIIRGKIQFAAGSFKDQVLIKSDATPTYNFACVVDDHDMQISQIIRGEDHISNTPKQLAIYEALQFPLPQFAHIPLIVAADRSRLSKRKGAMPVAYYKEQGYLPEALFNFLALLGWSPGENREIISKEEMITEFDLKNVVKTAAAFNTEKLEWMNGQYILNLDSIKLSKLLAADLIEKKYISPDYKRSSLVQVIELFKPRIKKLTDFAGLADFFFKENIDYDSPSRQFLQKDKKTKDIFSKLIKLLAAIQPFELEAIESVCRGLIAQEGIRGGDLIHPVRVALTGKRIGPGLFELMAALGKERVIARLKQAVEII